MRTEDAMNMAISICLFSDVPQGACSIVRV
jgi:hypothetical protein